MEEGVVTFAGGRSVLGVGQPGMRSFDSLEGVAELRPGALFSAPTLRRSVKRVDGELRGRKGVTDRSFSSFSETAGDL